MYEILDELIECLISFYGEINSTWRNSGGFMSVNLRKKTVADIEDNLDIWNMIRSYREFMSCQQASILRSISCLQSEANRVSVRIKQLNSIEYKIYRYCNGELRGKIPINKCLNDLFGIRIVINADFSHEDLVVHIRSKFPDLKITDSSKMDYIASHIYIMSVNQLFPWELQIWKKVNERSNLDSHKKYKQEYITWEKDFKNI